MTEFPAGRFRMVIVGQSPTPYYTAIQNAVADAVDLTVIFFGDGSKPSGTLWAAFEDPWSGPTRFRTIWHRAATISSTRADFRFRASLGVASRLAVLRPDVLVLHSWEPVMLEPLIWATLTRCPLVLWSESASRSGLVRSRASNLYRSLFVRRADALVSTGSAASAYLRDLGAHRSDVLEQALPSPLGSLIAGEPVGDAAAACRFLFVGRLVERKRPLAAVRAFRRLADTDPRVTLHVVGDGPLLNRAITEAGAHRDRVRFSGRLEGNALVRAYVDADVLVLPADREVWGLVVNEALAAGLYVIASDRVGSAADLLGDGLGDQFSVDDEDELVRAMGRALGEDASASAREFRRRRVAGVTPESFAAVLARAASRAMQRRRPGQSLRNGT